MITDDIAPLLTAAPAADLGFRQGTVLTWNSETGANTVNVAGTVLTDLPVLNGSEVISLKPGHVVGLLTFKSSWFILGRIMPPGGGFAPSAVAFGGTTASATNFSITTTELDKVSDTIAVPAWADEALVMVTATVSVQNTTGNSTDILHVYATINGVEGENAFSCVPAGLWGSVAAASQLLITSPGATIAITGRASTALATWTAQTPNRARLAAIAVFRSTS